MQAIPYLNFNGNCREAFSFYEQCFGGKIVAMFTHGETPAGEHCPGDWQELIMHARLTFDGGVLMASDAPPDRYEKPQGIWVSLHPETPAEAERIFHALAEGGDVMMPIQKTFWAERFGMVTDRFGIPWMVNCEAAG
ncbi:MAG TPA: VOC family protein [Armatimonadota bacterium]|nr:VOC family protein [Armatimonadota bacterium]